MQTTKPILRWIGLAASFFAYYGIGLIFIVAYRRGIFDLAPSPTGLAPAPPAMDWIVGKLFFLPLLILLLVGYTHFALRYLFNRLFPMPRPKAFAWTVGFLVMIVLVASVFGVYQEHTALMLRHE